MSELNKLVSFLKDYKNYTTRLYLVTRTLKDGLSLYSKTPDKYEYICYTINTDQQIQKELFNLFLEKTIYCANPDKYVLDDYSIVTDDAEKKILKYTKKEQVKSFIHIVDKDLKNSSELKPVNDLTDIADKLWAYIIEISQCEKVICGLRKMSPSKILVSDKKNSFSTIFKLDERSLKLSHDQSVVFDKGLDAIYANNAFYIIQKNNFEEIVGLESEYIESAKVAADKIMQSPVISLNFNLIDTVERKKYIRKLAKIQGEIDSIDSERIKKMQKTAKLFRLVFLVESGKIIINNEKEMDIVIKLIDDYYLQSQQTGKKYEASVKREI